MAMESTRAKNGSISSSSTQRTSNEQSQSSTGPKRSIYEHINGRPFLRDLPYPLPCDLAELQRQNLRSLLFTDLIGAPVCSPILKKKPPEKVLEVACGTGYWSSVCHDFYADTGFDNISFTGLDVVHVAPELQNQGLNWRFVQHDICRQPLPFAHGSFDYVMLRDLSLVVPMGLSSDRLMDESIRVLQPGGTLEIWESEHIIRSLLPHSTFPSSKIQEYQEHATRTASFLVSPTTPFGTAQNSYICDYNAWIQQAFNARHLSPTPCSRVAQVLLQEPDKLSNVGYRRIAIPLSELRWEQEGFSDTERKADGKKIDRSDREPKRLTEEQLGLREAALISFFQLIESLEPVLKKVSGKSNEEWRLWWKAMMTDLLEKKAMTDGECLEMGVWWAQRT